jgi:multisubunit Na+/H+ antiporter MnhG subunit
VATLLGLVVLLPFIASLCAAEYSGSIASMLVSSALLGRPVIHEVVITVLILVTSPVSAMTLMRAAIHRAHGT